MAGFEQLGLSDALLAGVERAGYDAPSELQRTMLPVLRRGGNAVVQAGSGSGITAAYGLALLDRFADASSARALVIVPTSDRAERVARTIALLGESAGARVAAWSDAWSAAGGAAILVASAEKVRAAIAASELKLEEIEAVVFDGVSAIEQLAGAEALDQIFTSLPKEGQRVLITSEPTDSTRKLAEAHARKAIHFPPQPAVAQAAERPAPTSRLRYVVAAQDRKADKLARLARAGGTEVRVVGRSTASVAAAERELRARGFEVQGAAYAGFERTGEGPVFAWDVPFSAAQLVEALRAGDTVIVERAELAHLKSIAAEANVALDAAALPAFDADSLNAFRNEIRRAAREEDIEAQLLVLEPLFDELTVEEVAAAASALLRARRPVKADAAATRPGVKTWARLFFSIGERDGVRPADIVGAITGESGIRGEEVGKVEIRDTFSVVEVVSTAADKVIRSMNGTTMKNRSLRVDYDRKTAAGGSRGKRPADRRPGNRARSPRER